MRYKFTPPPNWPRPPHSNWKPPQGWTPPAAWGPVPEGWRLWTPVKRSKAAHPLAITGYVAAGIIAFAAVGAAGAAPSSEPSTVATSSSAEATPADEPSDTPTDEPTDEPTQTKQPKPEPTVFHTLTARKWKLIARNPDAHLGETYVVYGQVTQADSATGDDTIRADVGGVRDSCSYGFCDYPTNTILTGTPKKMSKVVEDDTFRAKVTVLGSIDYDTTLGGSTTVPSLKVEHLVRTGSTS